MISSLHMCVTENLGRLPTHPFSTPFCTSCNYSRYLIMYWVSVFPRSTASNPSHVHEAGINIGIRFLL